YVICWCFFFQAEDGIRDRNVTGVQTCALPIYQRGQPPLYFEEETRANANADHWQGSPFGYQYYQAGKPVREQAAAEGHAVRAMRSEERRVGKEWSLQVGQQTEHVRIGVMDRRR